jgi:hypothetical protein
MVLTNQKPRQRNRYGEISEGLPGSTIERGMRVEKCQELGRTCWLLIEGKRWQGIRIMSHKLGKPTKQGRPDPKPERKINRVGWLDQKKSGRRPAGSQIN